MRNLTILSPFASVLCLGFVVLSGACSESSTKNDGTDTKPGETADAGSCATPEMGTLSVTVSGLPAGTTPTITVAGPSTRTLSANDTSPAAVGSWVVEAKDVVVSDPIVSSVYRATVTTSPAVVTGCGTASVQVAYALVPTSHALWITNQNGTADLLGYGADQLRASGTPAASVASQVGSPSQIAFDKEGNLWMLHGAAGETKLERFPANAVHAGPLTADRSLSSTAFNAGVPNVSSLAFDKDGNAWVSAPAVGKVVRVPAANLAASGEITPIEAITGLESPGAIAFDKDNNLWVAEGGKNGVSEFVATRLTAPITTAADVVVTSSPQQAPSGLAFDGSNNLWVNYNGGLFARYTPTERGASADVTSNVQVILDVAALAEGMTFDESGGLWFAYSQGKVARLGADQLTASGTITPSTILTSADVAYGVQIAVYPAPSNSPLYGKP